MNILNLIEQYLVQVIDLQVFALPRITLKPLVPSFPCFAKIVVSLMEKVSKTILSHFVSILQIYKNSNSLFLKGYSTHWRILTKSNFGFVFSHMSILD
jgi:hypothetical protein